MSYEFNEVQIKFGHILTDWRYIASNEPLDVDFILQNIQHLKRYKTELLLNPTISDDIKKAISTHQ